MYQNHFGLDRPPFKITPDTSLFFAGSQRGAALEALHYAIKSGEGIVKVVGEVGSGKTMLCRMLELRLSQDAVEVVYIANPSLSPDNILHVIAHELQLDVSEKMSKVDIMQKIQTYLLQKHANNEHVVLFVEEAQSMPTETLEEIRLLSNLETDQNKLLQMVLFGQPELDEKLALSHIRQLKERITHSFYLAPFPPEDILQYLNFRLRAVGYRGPDIFSKKTATCVKKYSNGLTRRINILADKALLAAYSEGSHSVSPAHIKVAAIDSEFAAAKNVSVASVITKFLWASGGAAVMAALLYAVMISNPSLLSPANFMSEMVSDSREPVDSKKVGNGSVNVRNVKHKSAIITSADDSSEKPREVLGKASWQAGMMAKSGDSVQPLAVVSEDEAEVLAENEMVAVSNNQEREIKEDQNKEAGLNNIDNGKIDERVAATRRWLSSAKGRNYSIQLLMARKSKVAAVEEFLQTLSLSLDVSKVYIYETELGKSAWYSIVYDEFSSYQKAMAALQKLPRSLKASSPYLRRLSALKREGKDLT